MDSHDERTSLIRSTSGVDTPTHNNNIGYHTGNGRQHNNNINDSQPRSTGFVRRDPRALLAQVQQSLASFQAWAANTLRGDGDSSVINWVQSARVARTFMIIINVILTVVAFTLMGVEMVEIVFREPLLDYLLPESEVTLLAAGLTIVAGAFGFAVAYNLLVEEDMERTGDERDNDDGRRGGNRSGGDGRDSGPQTPNPPRATDNMIGQNIVDPTLALQQEQTRHPKLMFTKASTHLMCGFAVLTTVVLIVLTISVAQRSVHLSRMDKELNSVWTEGFRHRTSLIHNFELRHQCCGFNSITDRQFPPEGKEPPKEKPPKEEDPSNPHKGEKPKGEPPKEEESCRLKYKFKVPCKADLTNNFERWQNGIQFLLLAQMILLVPLWLLVMSLSAIGLSKRKKQMQEGQEDAEAQTEASAAIPATGGGGTVQYERPLLEGAPSDYESPQLLTNDDAEPVRLTHGVVEPSLINI